jgi:peroxiredoxin Q/BCP
LPFSLLSDVDHRVAEAYGAWVEKSLYGRKYWGIQRATYLLDEQGRIAKIYPRVKPEGHSRGVLADLAAARVQREQ